jgi:hypothetical protein
MSSDKLVEIVFSNGNPARALIPAPQTSPAHMLQALGIERPSALIMIVGGAGRLDRAMAEDAALRERLTEVFDRGVAYAAAEAGALIIDGGTESGVMKLMGQGVAGCRFQTPLLGVSPVGRVTYPGGPEAGSLKDGGPLDPHHSFFVLAGEDWGDETATMYALADALVGREDPLPVVTVVAHGNTEGVALHEVLENVKRGWPVLALEGSGGLASEIAWLKGAIRVGESRLRRRGRPRLGGTQPDRELDPILAYEGIEIIPSTSTAEELAQRISHHLSPPSV